MREPNTRPFTADERARISSETTWDRVIITAWAIILSIHGERWEDMASIDPTAYVITWGDWVFVAGQVREAGRSCECRADPLRPVSHVLEWMNIGPSSGGMEK